MSVKCMICIKCGTSFPARMRIQKRCQNCVQKPSVPKIMKCATCGKPFTREGRMQKNCSPDCIKTMAETRWAKHRSLNAGKYNAQRILDPKKHKRSKEWQRERYHKIATGTVEDFEKFLEKRRKSRRDCHRRLMEKLATDPPAKQAYLEKCRQEKHRRKARRMMMQINQIEKLTGDRI